MEKIVNKFKNSLVNNSGCSVTFPLDTDNPESMKFIEYLSKNRNILEHNGKITFVPFGKNVDQFICGVVPIWKQYVSRKDFEGYYKFSEMMRELYCNEKDNNDKLIPIYAEINHKKFIITWQCQNNVDVFHYREASFSERGLLDVLWNTFGGITKKDNDSEIKQLNPKIEVSFKVKITKNYGYNFGIARKIYEHAYNLGYMIGGNINLDIG